MEIGEESDRIRLIRTTNPFSEIKPGVEGTVMIVGSNGTIYVEWDNGSILGMIPGEDEWEILKKE